jgi:hypothetical protein
MATNDRWDVDDLIAADAEAKRYPILELELGTRLTHRASGLGGTVVAFTEGQRIIIEDPIGARHEFRPFEGAFAHRGQAVRLRASSTTRPGRRRFTASGSIDAGAAPARVAKAARIWVEGIHDAELIEQIWGDDLRAEGIVVEPLHGIDDLEAAVAGFAPTADRRLGILLDHLVDGSKESRAAARVIGAHVLVTGHPYVDIWQAVRPNVIGLDAWPVVPPGQPWKEGVVGALGLRTEPGHFWQSVRSKVHSYRDVETPLITAVERLIDFVTTEPPSSRPA